MGQHAWLLLSDNLFLWYTFSYIIVHIKYKIGSSLSVSALWLCLCLMKYLHIQFILIFVLLYLFEMLLIVEYAKNPKHHSIKLDTKKFKYKWLILVVLLYFHYKLQRHNITGTLSCLLKRVILLPKICFPVIIKYCL